MSARNNESRLGAVASSGLSPAVLADPEEVGESGGSLSFVTPTEFVELPSKGQFYPKNHPLHGQEFIEIRYMTAKDEDILTSQSLLKKGVAIDRFLQNIVVNKQIKLEDLLVGDKNAVTIAARITGYGSEYNTKVTCPACSAVEDYSFELDALENNCPTSEELEEFGFELTENRTFLITLPKTGVKLEVRLLNGRDEKALANTAKVKAKHNMGESRLTDQLKMVIVSANGDISRANINSFVENMPAIDSKFFRTSYAAVTPNVNMKQYFECDSCGYDQRLEVPLTAEFFWPR